MTEWLNNNHKRSCVNSTVAVIPKWYLYWSKLHQLWYLVWGYWLTKCLFSPYQLRIMEKILLYLEGSSVCLSSTDAAAVLSHDAATGIRLSWHSRQYHTGCGRRKMIPQRYLHPNPQNLWIFYLPDRRDSEDMIKNIEKGVYPEVTRWTQYNHKVILRGGRGIRESKRVKKIWWWYDDGIKK